MKKLFSILMMLMCLGIYAQEKKLISNYNQLEYSLQKMAKTLLWSNLKASLQVTSILW